MHHIVRIELLHIQEWSLLGEITVNTKDGGCHCCTCSLRVFTSSIGQADPDILSGRVWQISDTY